LEAPGGDADALGPSASDGPGPSRDNTKDTTVARRATENGNGYSKWRVESGEWRVEI
jgi:hypothetical protein